MKLKDVVFGRRLSDADATSPGLPDVIADSFAAGLPMMRFLAAIGWRAAELRFSGQIFMHGLVGQVGAED